MQKRKIGNLEVSAIGMGCMGFTHAYGEGPEEKEGPCEAGDGEPDPGPEKDLSGCAGLLCPPPEAGDAPLPGADRPVCPYPAVHQDGAAA